MTHRITIPDDFPVPFQERRQRTESGSSVKFISIPIRHRRRMSSSKDRESEALINIRAYTRLTRPVLSSCPA